MHITPLSQHHTKGFALLFAVLTGSMLLAVGLAIFSIALKELDLSTAGRESQYAFYAADSGLECALYFDGKEAFPSDNTKSFSINDIQCASDQEVLESSAGPTSATSIFKFTLPLGTGGLSPCAIVSVEKKVVPGGIEGEVETRILSRGYNTCRAGAQQVERALQALY